MTGGAHPSRENFKLRELYELRNAGGEPEEQELAAHLPLKELYRLTQSFPILQTMLNECRDWESEPVPTLLKFVDDISSDKLVEYKNEEKIKRQGTEVTNAVRKALDSIPGDDTFEELKKLPAFLPIAVFRLENAEALNEVDSFKEEFSNYVKEAIAEKQPIEEVEKRLQAIKKEQKIEAAHSFYAGLEQKLDQYEKQLREILRLGVRLFSTFSKDDLVEEKPRLVKQLRELGALRRLDGEAGVTNVGDVLEGEQDLSARVTHDIVEEDLVFFSGQREKVKEAKKNLHKFRGPQRELDLFRYAADGRKVFGGDHSLFDNTTVLAGLLGSQEAEILKTTIAFDKLQSNRERDKQSVFNKIELALEPFPTLQKYLQESRARLSKVQINYNGVVSWEVNITEAVKRDGVEVREDECYKIRIQTPNSTAEEDPSKLVVLVERYPTIPHLVKSRQLLVFNTDGIPPNFTLLEPKGREFPKWFRKIDKFDHFKTRVRISANSPG